MYNYNGLPMVYSSLENNNKVPRKQFNLHLQQVPPQLQVQLPQSHNIQRSLLANSSATNLNAYLRGNRRYSSSGNSNPINDLLTSPKFIKSISLIVLSLHQHQPQRHRRHPLPMATL